mgnify:CR=1 FL=1
MITKYGDLTPRQAAHSVVGFLERVSQLTVLERFGQQFPMPKNATQVARFRRYFLEGGSGSYSGTGGDYKHPTAKTPLVEGVTPAGKKLQFVDHEVQIKQYGDWVSFTDVIVDTHEDYPALLSEMVDSLGEEAAQTLESLRYDVLKAGTNVFFPGTATARGQVDTPVSLTMQRRITRSLKRQNGRPVTNVLSSGAAFNTQPIEAAYVGLCHPDVENDIRRMDGFISTKHYAGTQPMEGEIGSVDDVRYIRSTVFEPYPDAGAATSSMMTTGGTNADVYPILYLARDAYGLVPLRTNAGSASAANVAVVNPTHSVSDPLAQRGIASWKAWHATVILQDAFLIRAEVAATE